MKHIKSTTMEVYETSNYGAFKDLNGNRDLRPTNIKKLVESMRAEGWVGAPVIVNENMEKIDGQNRIEAAEITSTPVPYIIRPGYGIKECIILNKNTCAWNNADYIHSNAVQGNPNYVWLTDLKKRFPEFSLDDISALAYNKGVVISQSDTVRQAVRDGLLSLTDEEKDSVENTLTFLSDYAPFWKQIKGRSFILYNAILYCHSRPEVDDSKLLDKVFRKNWDKIMTSHTPVQYLRQFDFLYNSGMRIDSKSRINTEEAFKTEHTRTYTRKNK